MVISRSLMAPAAGPAAAFGLLLARSTGPAKSPPMEAMAKQVAAVVVVAAALPLTREPTILPEPSPRPAEQGPMLVRTAQSFLPIFQRPKSSTNYLQISSALSSII